jgi:hypothetical protein
LAHCWVLGGGAGGMHGAPTSGGLGPRVGRIMIALLLSMEQAQLWQDLLGRAGIGKRRLGRRKLILHRAAEHRQTWLAAEAFGASRLKSAPLS